MKIISVFTILLIFYLGVYGNVCYAEKPYTIPGIERVSESVDIQVQCYLLSKKYEEAHELVNSYQGSYKTFSYQTFYMFQLCGQSTKAMENSTMSLEKGLGCSIRELLRFYMYNKNYLIKRYDGLFQDSVYLASDLSVMPEDLRAWWLSTIREYDDLDMELDFSIEGFSSRWSNFEINKM